MPAAATLVPDLQLHPNEIRFYQEQGYLHLPGLLKPDAVAALREDVMASMGALALSREKLGHATSKADKLRQTTQYLRGSTLDAFVNSESVRSIASQLIGGEAILYMPFTAVKGGGGGGRFHFHQDNQYTRHEPGMGSINIWFALVDMTPENGCLQVVPRSHRHGTLEAVNAGDDDGHQKVNFEPEDFLPVRMRAGDAIAFTRLTVHGSGPNETGEPRVAYALQYAREDVTWQAKGSDEWKTIKGNPRFQTGPVDQITPPKGDLDGH